MRAFGQMLFSVAMWLPLRAAAVFVTYWMPSILRPLASYCFKIEAIVGTKITLLHQNFGGSPVKDCQRSRVSSHDGGTDAAPYPKEWSVEPNRPDRLDDVLPDSKAKQAARDRGVPFFPYPTLGQKDAAPEKKN